MKNLYKYEKLMYFVILTFSNKMMKINKNLSEKTCLFKNSYRKVARINEYV